MRRVFVLLRSAVLAALVAGCAGISEASRNYQFQVLDQQVRPSTNAEVRVLLVHLPDGRPVTGAVITNHKFEMSMPNAKIITTLMVEGVGTPPVATVEEDNGVYLVHSVVPMAGSWTMVLEARVPGESVSIQGSVPLRVRS
ncbi:hypothetical protein E2C06_13015 [Dankookia rubra]|uniref:YtkA-like domain-containing protein n=1 Tax=Dankookia rubra TaxID=1442381 RepID=A0A4R5QH52_9PROT|nr:hypothetical protein [Dankookia rubra]TDH62099.1 hypothetical protein E2C06_13015 [Dankookia rubra]